MSLRRSARVQALPTVPAPAVVNGTKRKASSSNLKTAKSVKKTIPSSKDEPEKPALVTPPKRQTPRKRQRLNGESPKVPPVTPTPAAIGLMTAKTPISYSTGDIDDPPPPETATPRPAEPHVTNAPLKSPGSDKIVTVYSKDQGDNPAQPLPAPISTTNDLLDKAIAHLIKVDTTGTLGPVISKYHCKVFDAEGLAEKIDPFRSLSSGIMAQQVSGAAATSIKNKFIGLFPASEEYKHAGPPHFPPPALVAATPIPTLRTAGLSQRKAEYIQGMAEKFRDGELSAEMLAKASDDEVMEKLTAVRGLGKWSVEMFACFSLKRMDVLSTGDLGVQ